MVDLSPGATVRVVNPGATVRVSAPGLVRGLWLKEGPMGPGGRGITSIARTSGNGAPGTTDTYTITYDDATTSTFTVANGADGEMPLVPSPVAGRLAQVNAAGQVENSPLDAATVGTQIGDLYTAVGARVVGPASSTDLRIAVWSGTTGKLLSDSAYSVAMARNRTNHTGTQSADTITDGTTNKAYTATEQTKLAGIATAATANATDAQLRDRSTHTGTQAASTITGLAAIATTGSAADLSAGTVPTARLGSGTASATTYLRGDGTWATPAGGAGASAGGGLLASKVHNPATAATYTFGTAYANLDATNLSVTFTAPASGAVMVNLEGMAFHSATGVVSFWAIHDGSGAVVTTARQVLQGVAANHITRTRVGFLVTGLTAGTSYTYTWRGARGTTAGAGLYVGGPAGASATTYGPAQMEVWAA